MVGERFIGAVILVYFCFFFYAVSDETGVKKTGDFDWPPRTSDLFPCGHPEPKVHVDASHETLRKATDNAFAEAFSRNHIGKPFRTDPQRSKNERKTIRGE